MKVYAIGDDDVAGGYGMGAGPTPLLHEMLDRIGNSKASCIIQFDGPNGPERILCRWSTKTGKWVEEKSDGKVSS